MHARRILSIVLVGSLTVFALPSATRAEEVPAPETARTSEALAPLEDATPTLRGSIDRAASRTLKSQRQRGFAPGLHAQTRFQSTNGGGGRGMMILGLVGTLAGLAGTYYIMKSMREQTEQTQTTTLRR